MENKEINIQEKKREDSFTDEKWREEIVEILGFDVFAEDEDELITSDNIPVGFNVDGEYIGY